MRTALALAALLLGLTACALGRPAAPPNTGIAGLVLIGPMCPVVREDQPCPDRPFEATVLVLTPDGAQAASARSDAAGAFRVALAPGRYRVAPQSEGIAYAPEQEVTVTAGSYAAVQISYDSGIR